MTGSLRTTTTLLALALVSVSTLVACNAPRNDLRDGAAVGYWDKVARRVESGMTSRRSDRDYLLDRMRLGIALSAAGRPVLADRVLTEVFDVLRTQGINDDRTVAAAVFGEGGVIFWKGEPFEQALAYTSIAQTKGMLREWDNMRAAALSSLFLLKDFGENERGERLTPEDLAEEAVRRERSGDETYLDKGYTPRETTFALGYMLAGIANLAIYRQGGDPARLDEANDQFGAAINLRDGLREVADALTSGWANTVLIIGYGLGPEKIRYGPDGALARFVAITPSDSRLLDISLNGKMIGTYALACDVNWMSQDHMWNNLEEVRRAKSVIGQAMMLGGAITATAGDSDTAGWVGLGLILGGLFARATSAADLRHLEVLPQRVYVAALRIDQPDSTVSLGVAGEDTSRLTLSALDPPPTDEPMTLRVVRLPLSPFAGRWARSDALAHANDRFGGRVPGDALPWILGGTCVRTPNAQALWRYQSRGNLTDFTVADLEDLYRAEGITLAPPWPPGRAGAHILEGGRSLYTPLEGTAGYARLFNQSARPYHPRSRQVREIVARLRQRAINDPENSDDGR